MNANSFTGDVMGDEAYISMAGFRATFGSIAHKSTGADYYKWKADENPFGHGHIALVSREKVVAGSATVTFKPVLVSGQLTRCVEIGDTYTNPNFRRQGVFSTAVTEGTNYALDNGASFLYGTPNDESLPGYEKKLGYRRVPGVRVAIFSKRLGASALAARLRARAHTGPLSFPLAYLYLATRELYAAMRRGGTRVKVERSDVAPQGDGKWGSDRGDYGFFTLRDEAYLTWRFFDNPDRYEFFLAQRNGSSVGYLVTKEFERDGERIGVVCDFASNADERGIFLELLAAAERLMRVRGVAYIEGWCASTAPYHAFLRGAGYKEISAIPIIVFAQTAIIDVLLRPGHKWHFTRADSDNI